MGIAERKAREKLELRERIVEAAREMMVKKGFEGTSFRKIAEEIEYSPATIYLHFKNKDELFYAVHEHTFTILFERMKPAKVISHPVERLKAMGRIYVNFALEHSEYYDLMFIESAPMKATEPQDEWGCAMHTFNALRDTVKECIDQGYFPNAELEVATFTIFSHVHGMVALYIRDRLKMFEVPDLHQLMEKSMDHMVSMFRHGPLKNSSET